MSARVPRRVSIVKTEAKYPSPPFSPAAAYPEYPFDDEAAGANGVYEAVRSSLLLLGPDRGGFGTKDWNPLSHVVRPGQTVLIKPNLVNAHMRDGNDLAVVTHGSIIRAVTDYVIIALHGEGRIIIGDCPERSAPLDTIIRTIGLDRILDFYYRHRRALGGVEIEFRDLRRESIAYGLEAIIRWKTLRGDPEGYTRMCIDDAHSAFAGLSEHRKRRLYGADYKRRETVAAHTGGRHEYEIPNTVLTADVVINLPKLKTHYRVGTTLNCKGFIGLTGNKNLVPHRTLGDPSSGGDTYAQPPRTLRGAVYRRLMDVMKDELLGRCRSYLATWLYTTTLRGYRFVLAPPREDVAYIGGCWYGNDTTWRSVVDVTRAIHFGDLSGRLEPARRRRLFSVVDGIVGGDMDGPMSPRARPAGIVVSGDDMLAVDIVCTYLMGFDPLKVRYLAALTEKHATADLSLSYPDDISIVSGEVKYEKLFGLGRAGTLEFASPTSWPPETLVLGGAGT